MEKLDLREFDYFVNLGRDCRSLNYIHSFDRLYGNQKSEFFNKKIDILFDHAIFNNNTYLRIFKDFNFLRENIEKNFRIEIYDDPSYLINTFYKLKETQKGRINFNCYIGRYNFIKFNMHIDDTELLCNTDTSGSFEKFYKSIQENLFDKIYKRIKIKVDTYNKFFDNRLSKILFIRSEEVIDCYDKVDAVFYTQENFIKNYFYNSKIILISNKTKVINGYCFGNQFINHIKNINFAWGKPTDENQFKDYFIV